MNGQENADESGLTIEELIERDKSLDELIHQGYEDDEDIDADVEMAYDEGVREERRISNKLIAYLAAELGEETVVEALSEAEWVPDDTELSHRLISYHEQARTLVDRSPEDLEEQREAMAELFEALAHSLETALMMGPQLEEMEDIDLEDRDEFEEYYKELGGDQGDDR